MTAYWPSLQSDRPAMPAPRLGDFFSVLTKRSLAAGLRSAQAATRGPVQERARGLRMRSVVREFLNSALNAGLLCVLFAAVFAAQSSTQTGSERPTFSVRVNLVRLLVSVRNQFGAPLTTLDKQDFRVMDSGVPQEIAVFERNTSLPLSVAVLIDTSGSTLKDLHYEVDSVQRFVPTLLGSGNPQDSFPLFSFN